ncbi:germin-like protein subfamily 1 member 13 [Hevea brasiliensis]|uniref:germin-like protein subfamily 1 member 13 n=1 Tax=Hevea brasiliensis TaxID=3981 RepID=UPI0025EE4958|nr:germin-like protein subfamily 1 member 13 [Hevea brasiliensis]
MKSFHFLVLLSLALAFSFASAFDPSPLQDFCVAIPEPKNAVFVNGKFCKNPNLTVAEDFFFPGLNVPGNTGNRVGSNVTLVNVDKLFGLNTLGISLARLDFAPNDGLNPPHTHPRATEILVVVEGTLYFNIAKTNAVAFAGLSSQNPGVITIANAIFGPNPPINPDVLAKAFQLNNDEVVKLQKLFANA